MAGRSLMLAARLEIHCKQSHLSADAASVDLDQRRRNFARYGENLFRTHAITSAPRVCRCFVQPVLINFHVADAIRPRAIFMPGYVNPHATGEVRSFETRKGKEILLPEISR